MGLALQLIELAGPNWEAYWPAIKQALQGLTTGSLLYVAGRAASKGLPELAARIKNYQPVATPDNPQVAIPYSVPYMPMDIGIEGVNQVERALNDVSSTKDVDALQQAADSLYHDMLHFNPPGPPYDPCKMIRAFEKRLNDLRDRAGKIFGRREEPFYTVPSLIFLERVLDILAKKYGCEDVPF